MSINWYKVSVIATLLSMAHWKPARAIVHQQCVPECLRLWLFDRYSMSDRLRQVAQTSFQVNVIQQAWQRPRLLEAKALQIKSKQLAVVREVNICCDGDIWLYGRTVFPASTLKGKESSLHFLGNHSLGDYLFKQTCLRRSFFQIARIPLGKKSNFERFDEMSMKENTELWARRSTIYVNEKPLLLTEIFLPRLLQAL